MLKKRKVIYNANLKKIIFSRVKSPPKSQSACSICAYGSQCELYYYYNVDLWRLKCSYYNRSRISKFVYVAKEEFKI